MQNGNAKLEGIESDPAVAVRRERLAKIEAEESVCWKRLDAWDSVRHDPENWTRVERARRALPEGVEMIASHEEKMQVLERCQALGREKEIALTKLTAERRAASERLQKKYGPEYRRREKAAAEGALAFAVAVAAERELFGVLAEVRGFEDALNVPAGLDARHADSPLRGLLLDLVSRGLIGAAAIPAALETPKAAAQQGGMTRTKEPAWIALGARG